MWADDASRIDMLAYRPYADLITEIAVNDRMNPLTIGLFGNWGSGKSTLLHLIEEQVKRGSDKKIAVIKVNAWMFEGYEDAKTAIIQAILKGMEDNQTFKEEKVTQIKKLMSKISWAKVGKTALTNGLPLAISAFTGTPPIFLLPTKSDIDSTEEIETLIEKPQQLLQQHLKETSEIDIVENIRSFREDFSEIINESSVDNLIVLVDDLDRCNPDRIVETLEAIKLFLSVDKTTFVIAMDENIISYSIKRKYPLLNENGVDVSVDYIEKIVQLPIRIAELSESDVKNYLLLLIAEMFLSDDAINKLIEVLKTKGIFIKGEIISGTDILDIIKDEINIEGSIYKSGYSKEDFEEQLNIFNSIGNVVASSLKGNPRQTKRFLNTFYIRKRLAEIQNIDLKLPILAKLMVLEYADIKLFKELFQWQFEDSGVSRKIKALEEGIYEEASSSEVLNDSNINPGWMDMKIKRWLGTEPRLADVDLSSYFYLARDSISERRLFFTNLGQEERKLINRICNLDSNMAIRRKQIQKLSEMDEITRNEIFKGITEKFNQDKNQLETLIEIYTIVEPLKVKVFKELKGLKKADVQINEILIFKKLPEPDFKEIKQYYIETKKVSAELWAIGV